LNDSIEWVPLHGKCKAWLYNKINAFNQEIGVMINVKIFTFNPLQENTYLLYEEGGNCMIVDPGCYFEAEREQMALFIREKDLHPVLLVNTHCHLDHVFGNKFIHDAYGLNLHIHEGEKVVLDHAPASGLMWNMPFDNYTGPLQFLDMQQPLLLGKQVFKILFTPGHSPASISLYHEEQGILIAGDVLFRESVGRTDLPGGNPDILEASIRNVLYGLPDQTKVYSGHGPTTTIGHEKRHNPYVSATA
jgi:glyoxylase-like metal-dependent hydrolase (beta-lactamase superfamily II)